MKEIKEVNSEDYNYIFNRKTGFFVRWGKTIKDDPEYSPYGPEIADIELSTTCTKGCNFCYKSNKGKGKNMTLETFKQVFDKLPENLTQIAFGIGDIDANPDLFKIMWYCRENAIIPNITINGERMTNYDYERLAGVCGAVAVSSYDKNTCYSAVKQLTDRGMTQINIHALLAQETLSNCMDLLTDRATDYRLAKLNAIVFLWLKPIGLRNKYSMLKSMPKYKALIQKAMKNNISFGFDSCTASNFLKATKTHKNFEYYKTVSEPCESTLFSIYISVDGLAFPCSFAETAYRGVNVNCDNFIDDVWNSEEFVNFRRQLINNKDDNGCRQCIIYNLGL